MSSSRVRVLFLAANPDDTTKLRLDTEIREIRSKIRAAKFHDLFDFVPCLAVRPQDLLDAFNDVEPHVVHFSGHGSLEGLLILEDKDGKAKPVSEASLTRLFENFKDRIRLVVLNSCHLITVGILAMCIRRHVSFVINSYVLLDVSLFNPFF
jgi:hypothetical protein